VVYSRREKFFAIYCEMIVFILYFLYKYATFEMCDNIIREYNNCYFIKYFYLKIYQNNIFKIIFDISILKRLKKYKKY
jgi:hypothetical protein